MHHFTALPLGPGRVFVWVLLINHFLGQISGASAEGGEWRRWGPYSPPFVSPMAPSNERRHSHTHVLVPSWSLLFSFLLPSSLYSPVFLPSVKPDCTRGTTLVSTSSVSLLFWDSSPSSAQHALKTAIKGHFIGQLESGSHTAPMGCISSINCVVVYRLCNGAARGHKKHSWSVTFAAFCSLNIYVNKFAFWMSFERLG